MNISKEAPDELKEIYFKETGKMLTDEETLSLANQLFRVYRVLYGRRRPSTDPNLDK
ncbi:MAG: hypothetical protein V1846_02470 [Candidatus Komeilibacteria bacterium]